jgi:hypothetical protein
MGIQVVFAERLGFGLNGENLAFANLSGPHQLESHASAVRYWSCGDQRD